MKNLLKLAVFAVVAFAMAQVEARCPGKCPVKRECPTKCAAQTCKVPKLSPVNFQCTHTKCVPGKYRLVCRIEREEPQQVSYTTEECIGYQYEGCFMEGEYAE